MAQKTQNTDSKATGLSVEYSGLSAFDRQVKAAAKALAYAEANPDETDAVAYAFGHYGPWNIGPEYRDGSHRIDIGLAAIHPTIASNRMAYAIAEHIRQADSRARSGLNRSRNAGDSLKIDSKSIAKKMKL